MQRTAHGAAITGHCSELLLRSIADHAERAEVTPTVVGAIRDAAAANATAWQAWRTVAHAWDTIATPRDIRLTPAAAEIGDLVLRIGRLTYQDPGWAPGRGHASLAGLGTLVAGTVATAAALGAIHAAADALACIAPSDRTAVQVAAARNWLLVPTRLLPAYYDVPYRYTPIPTSMTDHLLSGYDAAVTAATDAATALDRVAVEVNSPTSVLAAIRSANIAEAPQLLHHGEASADPSAIRPWRREIERTVRGLGITDPGLLVHAADVDDAARDVIADGPRRPRNLLGICGRRPQMTRSEGSTPRPPGPPHRDAECYETAAAIQRAHPNWLVMWGLYTRQYIAFRMFNAPRGTIAYGHNPDELVNRMRQIQLQLSQRGSG